MNFKIIHYTYDALGNKIEVARCNAEDMVTLGGREAGICYMAENYFDEKINNSEAANKRALTVIGSGHHSPFDHGEIGLEISGIPKIMAMILNSTEFYTTSEKSARYTVMNPETQEELDVYNKWIDIFTGEIGKLGEDMTDKEINKLALENARYMLSVFTPTSMGYTTSYRQYCYMAEWLYKLADELKLRPNKFNDRLIPYCIELAAIFSLITEDKVKDNKNGYFQFLPKQYGKYDIPTEKYYKDMYQTSYLGSFAYLAQAHRHRTLHYEMQFSGEVPGEYGCYIPPIISGTALEVEWLKDFDILKDYFPQCTYVEILEQGRAHWFFAKCKERLCGRAQLEIAQQTAKTMQAFIENKLELSLNMQEELKNCTINNEVVSKCGFKDFNCSEHCRWGLKRALTRKI